MWAPWSARVNPWSMPKFVGGRHPQPRPENVNQLNPPEKGTVVSHFNVSKTGFILLSVLQLESDNGDVTVHFCNNLGACNDNSA
jgi:hypothetical protein